ncbi:MAG: hypothetical protein A2583_02230 [Bdellovibrionales bacterium RIFOXYD1_FULL_53_11]|nr:MAG: hypothetical protein A2583_02230 [Bdellovibrionales bacterium RIFOXYD1_FULL_53_11]
MVSRQASLDLARPKTYVPAMKKILLVFGLLALTAAPCLAGVSAQVKIFSASGCRYYSNNIGAFSIRLSDIATKQNTEATIEYCFNDDCARRGSAATSRDTGDWTAKFEQNVSERGGFYAKTINFRFRVANHFVPARGYFSAELGHITPSCLNPELLEYTNLDVKTPGN